MTQPHTDILSPPCLQHTWVSIRIMRNVILQSFNETEHTAHYSCYRIHIHGICCMKTSLLNSMHMTMCFSLIKFSGAYSVTFMCDNNWGHQHSCLTSKHSSKEKKVMQWLWFMLFMNMCKHVPSLKSKISRLQSFFKWCTDKTQPPVNRWSLW